VAALLHGYALDISGASIERFANFDDEKTA
jgi:hypothetical protein